MLNSRIPRRSSSAVAAGQPPGHVQAPGAESDGSVLHGHPGSSRRSHMMNRKSGFGVRKRLSSSANAFTPRTFIPRRSSSFGDLRCSAGGARASGPGSGRSASRGYPGSGRSSCASSVNRQSHCPRAAIKDDRPLTHKNYQAECAMKLSEFLQEHGYTNNCDPKHLLRMSTRDFEMIFQFLVSFPDPSFTMAGKLEDSALQCLKRLGYPYTLSKSMLMGIGSRLPQALAVLMWLLDYVTYFTEVDIIDHLFKRPAGSGNDDTMGGGVTAADLLRNCLDNPEGTDEDDERYLRSLAEHELQDDLELDEALERERKVLAEMEARVGAYVAVQEELEETKMKIENYNKYFEGMMVHCEKTREAMQEIAKSLADQEAEKVMLKAELSQLRSVLQEQVQKQQDKRTLDAKRTELQNFNERCRNDIEALKEEQNELHVGWLKMHEKHQELKDLIGAQLKTLESDMGRLLPGKQSAVLDDFDLRPVSTQEELQQREDRNNAASARLSRLMSRTEEKLRAHIKINSELAQKYEVDNETIAMELRSERRMTEKSKACADTVMEKLREEQASLFERFEKASSEIKDLEAQQFTSHTTREQEVSRQKKLLQNAKQKLEKEKRESEIVLRACRERMEFTKKQSKDLTRERLEMLAKVNNAFVAEIQDIKAAKKILKT